ncbi:hypothetical protein PIB30_009232 [Stylosanthes scabra]|uniref:Uncharacterized protein n=1 Tax=Stylosanthes scabra TaxID=79078 RepID=A0ABU6Q5Y0_9FABA|nr:hypothetical protein [Stylosanthes scabra]
MELGRELPTDFGLKNFLAKFTCGFYLPPIRLALKQQTLTLLPPLSPHPFSTSTSVVVACIIVGRNQGSIVFSSSFWPPRRNRQRPFSSLAAARRNRTPPPPNQIFLLFLLPPSAPLVASPLLLVTIVVRLLFLFLHPLLWTTEMVIPPLEGECRTREIVILEPDYRIPIGLLGITGGLAYTENLVATVPIGLLGILLLVQGEENALVTKPHCVGYLLQIYTPSSPYNHSGRLELAEILDSKNSEEHFADFPSLNLRKTRLRPLSPSQHLSGVELTSKEDNRAKGPLATSSHLSRTQRESSHHQEENMAKASHLPTISPGPHHNHHVIHHHLTHYLPLKFIYHL